MEHNERVCLGLAAYSEARTQGDVGIALVMQTVLNRVSNGHYGGTICEVVHAQHQYQGVEQWRKPRRVEPAEWTHIMDIADAVLAGTFPLPPECNGALGFSQFKSKGAICHVGAHYFTK